MRVLSLANRSVSRLSQRRRGHQRLSALRRREELIAWLLVSPWVIGFLLLSLGPMMASLVLSFYKADMLQPSVFVGLQNFRDLFSTSELKSLFWRTLYNTSYYVFFSVPLKLAAAFGLALALNQRIVARGVFRTLFYLPSVLPPVATSVLWIWVFHRDFGILNGLLGLVGIPGPAWLTTTQWAKPALIVMSIWSAGGNLLILLAGLQGVPTDLYDASKVDGAAAWSRFWNITVPMITPTLFFVLITEILHSFQIFVTTLVMTEGGPANATLMYVLYLYKLGFQQFRMGFASALAWAYFLILLALSGLIFKSSSAWVYYESEVLGGGKP